MFKAKAKAIVVIKAKVSQDATGELTPVPIVGGANTGSPDNGGAKIAVDGPTFAADLDYTGQSSENGTKSFAKAQVIASIKETVTNSSFLSTLTGDDKSDEGSDFPFEFTTMSQPPSESNPSQSSIAFSDEDSKNQYVVLQREGLNVLRSEIIATMEYIPVAGAEANSSLNEQDNNSEYQEVKIRNITKIIELHRQIREYMLAAAAKVYERTFSSYNKMIEANMPQIGVVDRYSIVNFIESAVNNWFGQGLLGGGNNTINVLVSLTENAQEADNTMDAVITTIIETYIEQNPTLNSLLGSVDLTSGRSNILFFRGLVEYFIYKSYVDTMISAYMSIDRIKDLPAREWQIDISGVRSIDSADIMQPGVNEPFGPMYYKSELRFNDSPSLYENLFGTTKVLGTTDTSMLYQTLMFMYSQLGLRDSVNAFHKNINIPQNEKEFFGKHLRIGHTNDLRDAFQQLTQLKIQDFISTLGTGTAYVRLGDFVSGQNLNRTRFRDIGSQVTQTQYPGGKYRQTSEMLAAYAFDFCINLNSPRRIGLFGTGNNESNFLFSSFGGLTYDQYRKQVLLGNFSSTAAADLGLNENSSNETVLTSEILSKQNSGPLILGNNTGGQSHRDFYQTKNVDIYESGVSLGSTMKPGAEYVFDGLILPQTLESFTNDSNQQIVDQEVKSNIENVFGDYKENSVNFLRDLGSIFNDYDLADNFDGTLSKQVPIGKMSAKHRIKNLLTYLAEDIDRIIDAPTRSIPLLAIFLSQGGLSTNSNKVKLMQLYSFLANFWGFVDSSLFSELLNLEPSSNSEQKRLILSDLISGLAHFYNEQLVQYFLTDRCDITAVLEPEGYHGGKYGNLLKDIAQIPSSGIDFNPSGFNKSFDVFLASESVSGGYPVLRNRVRGLGNFSDGSEDLPNTVNLGDKTVIRQNLNRCFTRSDTLLHDAYYNRDLSDSTFRKPIGLYRLFRKSFSAAAADLDFSNFLGDDIDYKDLGLTVDREDITNMIKMFTFANPADSQLPRFSDSESNYKSSLGPLKLKMHHKALVWYKWVFSLISDIPLQMTANVAKTDSDDGSFTISYNASQLRGLRDGLLEAADKIGSASEIVGLANQIGTDNAYKRIKKSVVQKVSTLAELVEFRERVAATTSTVLVNHASSIVNTYENSTINVSTLGPPIITALALTPLMGEIELQQGLLGSLTPDSSENSDIVKKWASAGLTIINKKSIASITDSANKYFNFNANKDLLVTNNLTSNINKIKFMYRILTLPGYGFLESEKKGLKTIMNVGVPAGLVNILRRNAFQETGNSKFLDSDIICISVHKKNHIDLREFYDPKHFVFDTGVNILDVNPVTKQTSTHLQNYSDEISLTKILSDLEIVRVNQSDVNSGASISQNYSVNQAKNETKSKFITEKGSKVLMNHVISYVLKEYARLTAGIDMSEDCFVMNLGQTNTLSSTAINVDQTKEETFQYILSTLGEAYPQVNEDIQLRNEVFRLTNIIKQMPPFSNKQNYIKTISPRKFDKVYSIIINEKDFTLRDNPDIFTQLVNKNIGSEIEINSEISQTKLNDYIAERELISETSSSNEEGSSTDREAGGVTGTGQGNQGSFGDFSDAQSRTAAIPEEAKIASEETVEEGLGDIFISRGASINKQINGYVRSLNENAPEVYNYSVSIALLPSDFLRNKTDYSKE